MSRAWGVADASTGARLREDHVFKACSNGKPLAAIVAMRLCERGVLDLDAPIWDFVRSWRLPHDRCNGFDPRLITLRVLLSHQGGLSLRGFPQVAWSEPNPPTTTDLLDGCFGAAFTPRMTSQPGTAVVYGGDGFTLAQLAMEDATARTFPQLLDELVAQPLGLNSSWFGRREDRRERLAACHDEGGNAVASRFYPALAASGLFTTASELARAYAGVSRLLSPQSARTMLTPVTVADNGWSFGLGFAVAQSNGRRVYKHAGWNEDSWGAAEGIGFPLASDNAGTDRRPEWPEAAAAVLCNSARGKDVCLPLLGAITQWLTTKYL
jgi:CubicO group peptidase (beta-lactamase class C family)